MNDFIKKHYLGGDARSSRGILSRGRNVYGASGRRGPKTKKLQEAAQMKLKGLKK